LIITAVCGHWQSELVNVGVAYCHSQEEQCELDLNPGTYYYQASAVAKGKGMVSALFSLAQFELSATEFLSVFRIMSPRCECCIITNISVYVFV